VPAVRARLRSGQIAIEVRIPGARNVTELPLRFTPVHIVQLETAVDDREPGICKVVGESGGRDQRPESHRIGPKMIIVSRVMEKLTAMRLGAFVAERHPFALGDVLGAFRAIAGDGRFDTASAIRSAL